MSIDVTQGEAVKGRATAIVGMSCRFPGAASAEEVFKKCMAGEECVRFWSTAELDARGVPEEVSEREPTL